MMFSRKMLYDSRILTAVTTAVVSTFMTWLYPVARDYGWKGVLNYVREGDPQPLYVRECKQILRSVAKKLEDKEKTVCALEEGFKRASVTRDAHARISRKVWGDNDDLDQLAAQLDQIISTAEIKGMKKDLSNRVVNMMERTDVLISAYKNI